MKRYQSEFVRGCHGNSGNSRHTTKKANALSLRLASAQFNPMPSRDSMSNRSSEASSNGQSEASASQIKSKVSSKQAAAKNSAQSKQNTSAKRSSQERLNRLTVGELGEDLVADWIQAQGGKVLERRWHCRRGELDIVALMQGPTRIASPQSSHDPAASPLANRGKDSSSAIGTQPILAFIEVKTRSRGNWDAGGLLAITQAKQQKIWHSAQVYLAQHPTYAALACRFDVALVRSKICSKNENRPNNRCKSNPIPKPTERAVPPQTVQPQKTQSNYWCEPSLQQGASFAQPPAMTPSSIDVSVERSGYQLTLQHYLPNAFQLD